MTKKDQILSRVDSYEILTHFLNPYTGGKKLRKNQHICSPIREERTPSFCIWPADKNTWLWKDHGSGESGDCFKLVMELHKCDFKECLKIIDSEMHLGLYDPNYTPPPRVKIEPPPVIEKKDRFYEIDHEGWTPKTLDWWGKFGITKITLDLFGVMPVKSFTSTTATGKLYTITANQNRVIFSYQISEKAFKIYQPRQKPKFMWLGNKPSDYVFGLDQLPQNGEVVFLTGGEKDVMTLHSFGYPAISLNSETATPSPELLKNLKPRFSRIITLYDNDNTGIEQSKKLEASVSLPFVTLPEFDGKDISDWAKTGLDKNIISELINQLNERQGEQNEQKTPSNKEENVSDGDQQPGKGETDTSKGERKSKLNFSWSQYREIVEMGLPENPDFTQKQDGILVSYKELKGNPYRISGAHGTKIDAQRDAGKGRRINAVYLPPALRLSEFDIKTLIITQDEITAWLLSELGIPSIGIHDPDGFLTRRGQKESHKLIKHTIRKHRLKEVVYVAPLTWWTLPEADNPITENPYEHIDTAQPAMDAVAVLIRIQEAFKRMPVDCVYPVNRSDSWLFTLLYEAMPYIQPNWRKEIAASIFSEIYNPDTERRIIHSFSVTGGTAYTFKEQFALSSPQAFFEFHGGVESLGEVFQWGKNVYEYDKRDRSVELAGNSQDAYAIREFNKRYYGQSKGGGEQAISDFTMKYELEVKQDNSFLLVRFKPIRGVDQTAIFHHSDIISSDTYKRKVADIPGAKFNFWGTKSQLEQIHAMNRVGVEEARSLENILGYSDKHSVYVFANGILTSDGVFHPCDTRGIVTLQDVKYFIPALSEFNKESEDFNLERGFCFYESGVSLADWFAQFHQVYGMPGHMVLAFTISSLYRDIFKKEVGKFPHLSIFAPPSSGKTELSTSIRALFGDIQETNLQTKIRVAAFERKMTLLRNALMILNEFNLSNPKIERMGIPDYLKGTYDFQGGEKTVNNKSRQSLPNSAFILIGQEAYWQKEALVKRCVIQELQPKTSRTQEERKALRKLKDMQAEGISQFHSIFFNHRHTIQTEIRSGLEETQRALESILGDPMIEARQIENWAMVLAPLLILMDKKAIDYPMTRAEILGYAAKCMKEQAAKIIIGGVLEIFFNFIASEYGPKRLLDHQDVFQYRKGNEIRIRVATCYKAFISYISRENLGIENTSKSDMIGRLVNHPAYKHSTTNVQVGYRKTESGHIAKSTMGKSMPAKPGGTIIVMDLSKMEGFSLPDIIWDSSEDSIEITQEEVRYAHH